MTRIRLDYVHEFHDRHGKVRRYFRRSGFKQTPLPGLPGSDEFMEAYRAALAGDTAPRLEIGASRTKPGTVNAAIVSYYASAAFCCDLAASTQRMRCNILERFRAEHGDKRLALLEGRHVLEMVTAKAKAGTPFAARTFLKVLRGLMQHAVAAGLRADDPTVGIKRPRARSDGFHTWSQEEIAQFEAHYGIGTRARLALALLRYTALRRSDVVRIGRQHIRDGMLYLAHQQKKKQDADSALTIPVCAELAAIIAATPSDHIMFLTGANGKPLTAESFGNWFRECCNQAGLPKHCSAHGLRKAACKHLAEMGCSALEIMAVSGHKDIREVQRYCAAAERSRMAKSGMAKAYPMAETRTTIGKPESQTGKPASNSLKTKG